MEKAHNIIEKVELIIDIMSDFLFFVFQALYTIFANMIDDGFANRINMDSVIAYGSYIPLVWTFQSIYNIGKYAYTTIQKEEKTCLFMGFSISVILLVLALPFYSKIHFIYNLSDRQVYLFNKILLCYLFSMPFRQIGDFIFLYLMCQFESKKSLIADVLYWVTALITDIIVFIQGKPVYYLVITTTLAYIVYDIFLIIASKIYQKKINFYFIKEAFMKGKDMVIDKLLGKVATLAYSSLATHLSKTLYAIHCIVYAIQCNCEGFTNNFNVYCVARLKLMKKDAIKGVHILMRKYGIVLIPIIYSFSYLFLTIYHGKVKLELCVPWLALYMLECISLLFYESYKAVLSVYSKTEYLKWGGLIGILVRIPFVFTTYKLGFGLWGFGIANALDFGTRAACFYIMAKKCERKPYCTTTKNRQIC